MNIAIIGIGNVGSTLGRRWATKGHAVTFGVRDPNAPKVLDVLAAAGANASAVPVSDAASAASIVVLATPWDVTESVLDAMGDLSGKILVDCTNPLRPGLAGLELGYETSGAERVATWAPGSRVIKAFNTTGSGNMANPLYPHGPISMLVCGDDTDAKETVLALARDLDFDAIDAGGLESARYLEPFAMLWISLAYRAGLGPDFALSVVRR